MTISYVDDYQSKKRNLLRKLSINLPLHDFLYERIVIAVLGEEKDYEPAKPKLFNCGNPSLQTMRTAHGYFADKDKVREYRRIFNCSVTDITDCNFSFKELYDQIRLSK